MSSSFVPTTALGQISTDGTLGIDPDTFPGPAFQVPSSAGRPSGNSLFFSFREFNVPTGSSVDFTKSIGFQPVENVISRVTGGSPSNISGNFKSSLDEHNFYFLNPWGVVFGSSATLDLKSSFHVSTADEIRSGNETFSARAPDATLLSADPTSFGFLSVPDRGDITVRGTLEVARGSTIDLIGGNVTLDSGLVWARGGSVRIAAVESAGTVTDLGAGAGLDVAASGPLGAIELLNSSTVSVSNVENGSRSFSVIPDLVLSGLLEGIQAGDIEPGDVKIGQSADGSHLAVLRGLGNGKIFVRGDSLSIRDSDIRARLVATESASIQIDLDGRFEARNETSVEDVGVTARRDPIQRTFAFFPGIPDQLEISSSFLSFPSPNASPTTIQIHANEIALIDHAQISATTFNSGPAGNVRVEADESITIRGVENGDYEKPSAIFSNAEGTGDGGLIHVEAPTIELLEGGAIVAQTTGNGHAGNIEVAADRLLVGEFSQIDSSTSAQILNGAPGSTTGNGGNVSVIARDSILLEGGQKPGKFGQISTGSQPQSNGTAGSISVSTPRLEMRDGARISVATRGGGTGGDIDLDVGELDMQDAQITAESTAVDGGAAGSIRIGTQNGSHPTSSIHLTDSDVTVFAKTGPDANEPREGSIHFELSERLRLSGSSEISSSVGTGRGGNITIASPQEVILEDQSAIRARTDDGTGGKIQITAKSLFPDREVLTREGRLSADAGVGTPGVVELKSPELNLYSQMKPIEANYADAASQLRSACAARMAGEGGSFAVANRGGLGPSPDGWLLAFDEVGGRRGRSIASTSDAAVDLAQSSSMRGREAFRGGRYAEAEDAFSQSIARSAPASTGDLERVDSLRDLAQTQQARGRFVASVASIEEALRLLPGHAEPARRASLLDALGNARLAMGDLPNADSVFSDGLEAARAAGRRDIAARIENHRANAAMARGDGDTARAAYLRAAELATESGQPGIETIARSGAARAALESTDPEQARAFLDAARAGVEQFDDDGTKVQLLLHLAQSEAMIAEQSAPDRASGLRSAHALLREGMALATRLGERRALSFALGLMASLYESEARHDEALTLTRRAREEANLANEPALLARWHRQEARLLWAKGKARESLLAHRRAIVLLEETRQETVAQYGASGFRSALAPYYLDFVEALLDTATRIDRDSIEDRSTEDQSTALLLEARMTMERLKAAELRDHFRDECIASIESRAEGLDEVLARSEDRAAVVYPILLPGRLELLVTFPSGLTRYSVPIDRETVSAAAHAFEQSIHDRITNRYRTHAQQLYDWLVRPYAERLVDEKIDTLVFVPDGALRTIPLAALHDGERFLIERNAVVLAPGLSLVDPKPFDRDSARFLIAGVSKSVQGFDPLPAVPKEANAVRAMFGGELLLDEGFRTHRFEQELRNEGPSVVHIASHAQFTGDPATSFVLAYDDKIRFDDLARIVAPAQLEGEPIELLVLSACETAAGDEQAALGLTGAAIRAGARSAIGSLWAIDDEIAFDLILGFYEALRSDGVSKARALQLAQQKILHEERSPHPFYWSSYVLVSNWL